MPGRRRLSIAQAIEHDPVANPVYRYTAGCLFWSHLRASGAVRDGRSTTSYGLDHSLDSLVDAEHPRTCLPLRSPAANESESGFLCGDAVISVSVDDGQRDHALRKYPDLPSMFLGIRKTSSTEDLHEMPLQQPLVHA